MKHLLLWMGIILLTACESGQPATIPPPSTTAATALSTSAATSAPTTVPTLFATATLPATSAPTLAPQPTSAPPTSAPSVRPPAPTATRAGFNMRGVDWFKVVTTDPNLKYDPSIAPPPGQTRAPWVELNRNSTVAGHALIETAQILFVDISGDGQEEAIISIFSGGTAGNTGLLVYTVASNTPVFADAVPGYKLGGVADGNRLKVTEPIFQGWEPNCCPSGFFLTRYRLQANKLVQVSREEEPLPEAKKLTVEKFYELLSAKNYADAYNNFLSANYRASHPYAQWVAGYGNTQSFTYTTADLPDGRVKVDLVAIDKTTTGTVTKKFTGSWKLIWASTARFKQWVLDAGSFSEVK